MQGATFPEDVSVSISEEEALRMIQGGQEYQQASRAQRGGTESEDAALTGWWDSTAAGGAVEGLTDSWTEIAKVCLGGMNVRQAWASSMTAMMSSSLIML